MVSIISLKEKVSCDTRKCLFRCRANTLWCSAKIYFRAAPLPDICKSLTTRLYPYADNICIFYHDKDVEKTEKVLNKEFSSLCEWCIDIKQSIHFGVDKTKNIFFFRMKSPPKLMISYGDCSLQQHNTVEYIGCYLDSNFKGVSMARRVLKKINFKLNF